MFGNLREGLDKLHSLDKFTNPEHPLMLRHPLALGVLELSMVYLSTMGSRYSRSPVLVQWELCSFLAPCLHSSSSQMDLFKESPLVEGAEL